MNRVGIGSDGKALAGLDHVIACIDTILSTEIGARIQRRDFGSKVPALLDRPQNEETIVDFIMAVAEALEPRRKRGRWYGEPGLKLEWCGVDAATPAEITIIIRGTYCPRGHLGDFTPADGNVNFTVSVGA